MPTDGFGIFLNSGHILFNFYYDETKADVPKLSKLCFILLLGKTLDPVFKCYYPGGWLVCLGVVQYNFVQTDEIVILGV